MVDGHFESYTLEDKVREIPGVPVAQWKVKGQTAIPAGRYKVTIVWSPKHQFMVPLVNDVPGFSAIEIHPGNTDADTEGCLLLGDEHVPGEDMVSKSNLAWDAFMLLLEPAFGLSRAATDGKGKPLHYDQTGTPQEVWITYQNNFMQIADPDLAT